jgi:hypothetical protein
MEGVMHQFEKYRRGFLVFIMIALSIATTMQVAAQQVSRPEAPLYEKLKKFELRGKVSVSNLTLKRDRAVMVFNGDFYFAAPVNEKIAGAVFMGEGTFRAEAPNLPFEKEYMKRFINADVAESDFHTAVLRFSDDTYGIIGKGADSSAEVPHEAQKLATELDERMLKETGANVSARLLLSLSNNEPLGIFLAQFDKGRRGRFTYLVDPQARLLGSAFEINGGEKVLLFAYSSSSYTNDLWIATYSEQDFEKKQVRYSDEFDLIAPLQYKMEIDVREARRILKTKMRIDCESLVDNLTVIPMTVNEGLTAFDNKRLRESMRMLYAKQNGQDIAFIQEDWETGLTLVLPRPMKKGEQFNIELSLEGDYVSNQRTLENNYYPQDNTGWFPKHGYLKRSKFDLIFRHSKLDHIASVGKLIREEGWPDSKDDRLTEFRMDTPVSFATFAAGRLERKTEKRKLGFGEMSLDFYSIPASVGAVKESFMLAEMGNALDFFSQYFGPYPYGDFRATVHPFNVGQGFATLLLLPSAEKAGEANRDVFSLIAHETSHQWWGNIVAWRSYRDQWLSEGFAEYSGMLYTGFRDSKKSERELIKEARFNLEQVAKGDRGVLGKVAEVGPLIFGERLNTRLMQNAYESLVYAKGALVLRMLHFLFTDPNTGKGDAFFQMLADFVKRYQGQAATTEDFVQVASEHFAKSPIGRGLGLRDLNWFFNQWVYEAKYPSYRLEYGIEEANGKFILSGTIFQENAGPGWFMPLPITVKFGNQEGRLLLHANGPQTAFKRELPSKPSSVELDPDYWIFSEKTSTKKQ